MPFDFYQMSIYCDFAIFTVFLDCRCFDGVWNKKLYTCIYICCNVIV